jgi:energy-coupling factor transporter ATP-binding protein EcfA2
MHELILALFGVTLGQPSTQGRDRARRARGRRGKCRGALHAQFWVRDRTLSKSALSKVVRASGCARHGLRLRSRRSGGRGGMGAQAAPDGAVNDAYPNYSRRGRPGRRSGRSRLSFAERASFDAARRHVHAAARVVSRSSPAPPGSARVRCSVRWPGSFPHQAAGTMAGLVRSHADAMTRTTAPADLAPTVGLVVQSPDDQICTSSVEAEIAFGLENFALPPARSAAESTTRSCNASVSTGFRHAAPQTLSGGSAPTLGLGGRGGDASASARLRRTVEPARCRGGPSVTRRAPPAARCKESPSSSPSIAWTTSCRTPIACSCSRPGDSSPTLRRRR